MTQFSSAFFLADIVVCYVRPRRHLQWEPKFHVDHKGPMKVNAWLCAPATDRHLVSCSSKKISVPEKLHERECPGMHEQADEISDR